jgi:hypothetical protein
MSNPEAGTRQSVDGDAVDDHGTSQDEARTILKKLRDQGFDSSDEQFAVALGRPVEEVKGWIEGTEPVDDDVIMKARGIAQQRGIGIE